MFYFVSSLGPTFVSVFMRSLGWNKFAAPKWAAAREKSKETPAFTKIGHFCLGIPGGDRKKHHREAWSVFL